MKNNVIEAVRREKLIAIIRGVSGDALLRTAEALIKGGVRLAEITFDQSGKISKQETGEMIAKVVSNFGSELLVGACTVLTPEEGKITMEAGGKYLISPNTNEKVIAFANENGLVSMPGAMTPTEIEHAYSCGADFVKIFPGEGLGLSYIKAVRAPLSHIPLLAVGGVDLNNIGDFFKAGACGVGIGSNIVKKDLIAAGEYDKLTELAAAYCNKIAELN